MSFYSVLKVGAVIAAVGGAVFVGYKAVMAVKEEERRAQDLLEISIIKFDIDIVLMTISLIISLRGESYLRDKDPLACEYYDDLQHEVANQYRGCNYEHFLKLKAKVEYLGSVIKP